VTQTSPIALDLRSVTLSDAQFASVVADNPELLHSFFGAPLTEGRHLPPRRGAATRTSARRRPARGLLCASDLRRGRIGREQKAFGAVRSLAWIEVLAARASIDETETQTGLIRLLRDSQVVPC